MVQIKIKGINNAYHIFAQFDDVTAFFTQLEERLKACCEKSGKFFEAFFHVQWLDDAQLLELFALCGRYHTLISGINELPQEKPVQFMEKELHGGEHYHFDAPVILLGNVRKQAFISSSESLYIFGAMHGSVDLLHEDCHLVASAMDGNVRICDSHFQNLTSFAPANVYYVKGHLETKEYKEERMWERQ